MKPKILREFLSELALFGFAIGSVSLFWRNSLLAFSILVMGWIIAIIIWHTEEDIILFIVGAIGGPTAEIICIKFGAWQYSNPDFLGIPIWLILVWGYAAVFIDRARVTIKELTKR